MILLSQPSRGGSRFRALHNDHICGYIIIEGLLLLNDRVSIYSAKLGLTTSYPSTVNSLKIYLPIVFSGYYDKLSPWGKS